MKTISIVALMGLAAAASAQSVGQAKIVSYCSQPVYYKNTPCSGGPSAEVGPHTLNNGDSYTQTFTELDGGCGWSIKIGESQEHLDNSDPILQYEYTYQGGDQPIWYDMSLVNTGASLNPEDYPLKPYHFESSDESLCAPNSSVAFDTPTGPGMQIQCPNSVSITLNLCNDGSGSSSGSGSSGSSASSSAAATTSSSTYVAAPTSQSSTLQTVASSSSSNNNGYIGGPWTVNENNVAAPTTTAAAVTTTAVTSTSIAPGGAVVVHTNVEYVTQISTVIVTARDAAPTPAAHKRHVHGHPHGGRA